jgi:Ca2+-transporting ATPase
VNGPTAPRWHTLAAEEALLRLGSRRAGLSDEEAARRLLETGPNEIRPAPPPSPLAIFAAQFRRVIVGVLVLAAILSGVFGDLLDCVAILAIVVLNGIFGFLQEFRAERSLQALRRLTAPRARVVRGGAPRVVPAAEVVPGDVIELDTGDLVPADARLLESHLLRCGEAALTGESEPVAKRTEALEDVPLADRANCAFLGTTVAAGRGRAVVAATGMSTEMGRIATLLESTATEPTPLQRQLAAFGKLLLWACLGIVCLLFLLGLLRGLPLLELFLTSVSLAVAAVPEGLPAVVTIALAVGVQRMARRRTLVRRLHAVETLGSADVICSDKTGTLTVGEMTVRALYAGGAEHAVTGEGYSPEGRVLFADPAHEPLLRELASTFAGCNGARLVYGKEGWGVHGDPTEGALLAAAGKLGVTLEELESGKPALLEFPFDSDRKRMTIVRKSEPGPVAYVKGAPDLLLPLCDRIAEPGGVRPITDGDRARIVAVNASMADRALRVLAGAFRELEAVPADAAAVERGLVFQGLAGMQDPPRAESKEAVRLCRSAGIRPVMITGDHPKTALAVARELGIAAPGEAALSGVELDLLPDEALRERVPHVAVFARVTAEHKLRIVRAWRARGSVVAMTGDGVNDAPALKGADIGISMGRTGTEVTKEASDMVITDDNFATIVSAVEEGRGIYDNIRKTVLYLLTGNVAELLYMGAAVAAGLPIPLAPIQLLWINLVTDGLPALCLAVDPIDRDVMTRPPRPAGSRLADARFLRVMGILGVVTSGLCFAVYEVGLSSGGEAQARSLGFTALVFGQLFCSFGFRSASKVLFEVGLLSNLRLLAVVAATFGFHLWILDDPHLGAFLKTAPLPLSSSALLLVLSLLPVTAVEISKLLRRRRAQPA